MTTCSVSQLPPAASAQAEARVPSFTRIDALVDVLVDLYAPLPGPSLAFLVRRLRYAVPQWQGELTSALERVKQRLSHTYIDGVSWYWPGTAAQVSGTRFQVSSLRTEARREITGEASEDRVRLLAPFDPVVRDRARFELLWSWPYRFEAYTPAAKRKLGYYALPLLWRDRVIGWGNLSVKNGELNSEFGYVKSEPRDRNFKLELAAELDRMRAFLSLKS